MATDIDGRGREKIMTTKQNSPVRFLDVLESHTPPPEDDLSLCERINKMIEKLNAAGVTAALKKTSGWDVVSLEGVDYEADNYFMMFASGMLKGVAIERKNR